MGAKFVEYVSVLPPDRVLAIHVPFPDISDRSCVHITLDRWGCFGRSPIYTVTISGDGAVVYNGGEYTAVRGVQHSQISPDEVSALIDKFRAADFFSLYAEYRANVTDNPTYFVTFTAAGKKMKVTDYIGLQVGMPYAVAQLENEIDFVSGSARWVTAAPIKSTKSSPSGSSPAPK